MPPSPSKPGPLTSHPISSSHTPTPPLNLSPSKQRSRFQEGSMNDRASAVPPLDFIGPEQEAFERRMELHYPGNMASQRPVHERATSSLDTYPVQQGPNAGATRPISAASSYTGKRGFWGGLKEKFSFSRDKADGSKRPVSLDAKASPAMGMGAGPGGDARQLPSREEIMANYQELMRNGFFDSHATQSTRQPPPGAPKPSTPSQAAPTGPSFASRMGDPHRRPQQHWPLPTIASPGADSLRSRGTKRTHTEDGDSEHIPDEPASSFKRLRKSASRISSDISIPRLRTKRSQLNQEQQHAADMAAMPPPPAPGGIRTRRSFSSASKRETNRLAKRGRPGVKKAAISAPIPLPPPNADGADTLGLARMSIDSGAPSFASSYDSSRPGSSATTGSGASNWTFASGSADAPEPLAPAPALRVRPDANRGIPMVPRIPEQYKSRFGYGGSENVMPTTVRQHRGQWAR